MSKGSNKQGIPETYPFHSNTIHLESLPNMTTIPASEEIQPQSLTPSHPLHVETEHVSVQVDERSPRMTEIDEHVSVQVKGNTDSSCEKTFEKVKGWLVSSWQGILKSKCSRFIFYTLLRPLVGLIAYPFLMLALVVVMPVLLVAIVVARLVQFFVKTKNFKKHYRRKSILRCIATMVAAFVLISLGLFYLVAKYVPKLKHIGIVGLPMTKWISITIAFMGIYILSQGVWFGINWIIIINMTSKYVKPEFVIESVSEISSCLLFQWAVRQFLSHVIAFKHSKIVDVYRNWIEVFIFLLIGYNIITLLTCLAVWFSSKVNSFFKNRYLMYVVTSIQMSILVILNSLMLLLTWVLYFDNRLNSTSRGKRLFKFGTGSLVSGLICSFLSLIKTSGLLYWKANVVYDKLRSKIPEIAQQMYFCCLLGFNDKLDYSSRVDFYDKFDAKRMGKIMLRDSNEPWCLYDLQEVAQSLIAQNWLCSDDSLNLSHLIKKAKFDHRCSKDISGTLEDWNDDISGWDRNISETLKGILHSEKNWERFLDSLSVDRSTPEISFQQVEIWLERVHAKCSYLANVVSGEEEAAKCLDNVLGVLVISITLISWLLLCQLTTTTVLIVVATPLLATSFIFGDTCKTLFQGLIFIYIIHPFNVGEQCIIDGKQLEVKRIGVWNCIFFDFNSRCRDQHIVYANSELATKNFINYKTEIDWTDYIEFSSSVLDNRIIPLIQADVESYFDSDTTIKILDSVKFLCKGDVYKVAINVKYTVAEEEWSYRDFLKEKEIRRSKLSINIQSLLQERQLRYKRLREREMKKELLTEDDSIVP